ncbi:MAG: DNA-formamidopyrimidine glycosylase family protein [Planctomycetota bacterium]
MPEGHTVHRIASDHIRDFAGEALAVSSPQGRFAGDARKLDGRVLESVEAHGKHFCYRWEGNRLWHVHLGLYGKFRRHKTPPPDPRGQVRVRVIGERFAFDLNGPNACHVISTREWAEIQARLGPDPLRGDADPDRVWQRVHKSRAAIGTLLMNQSVVAGVGNIYRTEVLFLLGIHPERPGNEIDRTEFDALWKTIVRLMKIGKRYNRIIIADPREVGKPLGRMNRDERLLIYKRDWCPRCENMIEAWKLGGRTVFACPACQNH